ncbi:MAG: DUF1318 domain-containing protein [Kiritimatiellaceae bacterium]|nr:DUF1318 domain-containing protein [Kiritimatiellaceae bacterium]
MKKLLLVGLLICAAMTVSAQATYDIKEMTPAVKSALDGRKSRFAELKTMKAQGVVGENNRGYVQALGGGADVKALVAAENKDRKQVYEAIVQQNKLGPAALPTVEAVFARVQRDKADPGDKVQDASGSWN